MKMSLKKKPYNGRDKLKVALINGATKANIAVDKKKEKNKKECRNNGIESKCWNW